MHAAIIGFLLLLVTGRRLGSPLPEGDGDIVTMVSLGVGIRKEFIQTFQAVGLETVRVGRSLGHRVGMPVAGFDYEDLERAAGAGHPEMEAAFVERGALSFSVNVKSVPVLLHRLTEAVGLGFSTRQADGTRAWTSAAVP